MAAARGTCNMANWQCHSSTEELLLSSNRLTLIKAQSHKRARKHARSEVTIGLWLEQATSYAIFTLQLTFKIKSIL